MYDASKGVVNDFKEFISNRKWDVLLYVLLIITNFVVKSLPVHEMVPSPNDPLYSFTKKPDIVNRFMNVICNYYIPLAIFTATFLIKRRWNGWYHCLLAFMLSELLTGILVEVLKDFAGRPRPYYNTVCTTTYRPTCNKSFPSGHTAYAFQGQLFLSLVLSGLVDEMYSDRRSHLVAKFACFIPCVWATVVGFTRIYDHHHHTSDVIAGMLLGSVVSLLMFVAYRRSIFAKRVVTEEELFAVEFE